VKALFIIILALAVFGAAGYATYRLFIQPEQALKMEKLLPPPPPPPDPTVPEFQKCVAIKKSGKLVPARDALYSFIEQYPESSKGAEARDMLGEINTQIYLTPFPAPDKEVYVVKPGETIDRVARHLKTTGEMIVRANNLKGTAKGIILQIGQKLTVPNLDLTVVINRKQDRVIILNKGRFFKWYPVVAWPPPLTKKPVAGKAGPPVAKQAGKVTEKMAWYKGQRVMFTDKGYAESTHWIQINIAHCTLHSVADEKAEGRPPGGGIVLAPQALEELAALLNKGDTVTLE
jgi:LysM repeat protein